MTPRRPDGPEEGSAGLIIALVFVAVFGLFIGALLGFVDASYRSSNAAADRRQSTFAADGGIDGATVRAMTDLAAQGPGGTACPTGAPTTYFHAAPVNHRSVDVTCEVLATTSPAGGGSIPSWAVVAKGGSVAQDRAGRAVIDGSVYASLNLEVKDRNGILEVRGLAGATKACRGRGVVQASPRVCSGQSIPADPNYGAPGVGGAGSISGCAGPGSFVTVTPGRFASAAPLSALTRKGSACPGSVIWLQPGAYQFDTGEWKVDDAAAIVVAGTKKGPWATDGSKRPTVPGGCDMAGAGVELVFAGASRLTVNKGRFEICPPLNGGGARVAIYGPTSGVNLLRSKTVLKKGDKATLVVNGEVYAPTSSLDIGANNSFSAVLARGAYVKGLKLRGSKTHAASTVTRPNPNDFEVRLQLTGLVNGFPAVTANVSIFYLNGATRANVNSWEVLT